MFLIVDLLKWLLLRRDIRRNRTLARIAIGPLLMRLMLSMMLLLFTLLLLRLLLVLSRLLRTGKGL